MQEQKQIRFKDLSFWLKVGIIGGIIYIGSLIFAFVVGFLGAA